MTIIELLQREFEQEVKTTRKMLACVPNDKYDWKPHKKSMTVKQLVAHIAELPAWIGITLTTDELDFAANPYQTEDIKDTKQLLDYFERMVADGREHLKNAKEETFGKLWTLRDGAKIYSTEPKIDVIRMSFSQIIHHRAQLGVNLRLLNIAIPGSYGPSADEMEEWKADTATV